MRWVRRSLEQAGELARDEELRHRRQAIEERTYAQDLQSDDHHAPGVLCGVWIEPSVVTVSSVQHEPVRRPRSAR